MTKKMLNQAIAYLTKVPAESRASIRKTAVEILGRLPEDHEDRESTALMIKCLDMVEIFVVIVGSPGTLRIEARYATLQEAARRTRELQDSGEYARIHDTREIK